MLTLLEMMHAILPALLAALLVLTQDLLFAQHALLTVQFYTICSLARLNAPQTVLTSTMVTPQPISVRRAIRVAIIAQGTQRLAPAAVF